MSDDSPTATTRVAIIGSGAAGSSAAFWVGKAKERFGLDVEIDVYDRESYIGGRSTVVYPYGNESLKEIELGASIFVKVNKNLWRAIDEFNLTRRDFFDEDYATAVWDGEQFLVTYDGGWWDSLKALWRYGWQAFRKTEASVKGMLESYAQLYAADGPKWGSISELSRTLGFENLVSKTTAEHFLAEGVSSNYIYELIEAATLVNYGQDADSIHALEGACSMASSSASGVDGGNFLMFEQFLNHSNANVYLDTPVTSVSPREGYGSQWTVTSSRGSQNYRGVILAAPFHGSRITVPASIEEQIPPQPYVKLHVTLLTTTSPHPSPAYFGLPDGSKVPQTILTSQANSRQGGKKPEFNSLTYHHLVREGEWSVKIFSAALITDEWLGTVFGEGSIKWTYRKEWDAYPKLPPTATYPPIKLDRGFYYVNSFEPFISTMETETIASRNVADLFLHEEFQSGICGPRALAASIPESKKASEPADWIYGWDC